MAADLGTLELGFRAKLDQLDKELAGAKSKATKAAGDIGDDMDNKVTSKLERARTVATGVSSAFAGLKVSNAFTNRIQEAGDVARVFGDQVSGAASATGLSMDVLAAKAKSFEFIPPTVAAEGIKNLSLLNQSMGITGQASLDLSSKTLDVAQAMSVVAGVPVEEVLNGVAGAARGEYDQIQKLVPSLNGAAVEQRALADSGKSTAKELTEAEKSQAALNMILDEGNRYLPQLAANSDNAAAAQRRKAAAAEEAKIAMGDKLLPIMEKVSNVTSTLFGWFSKLPGPVQTVVLGVIVLAGVLAPLGFAVSGVAGALGALGIGGGAAATGTAAAGTAAAAASPGFFAMAAGVWATLAPILAVIAVLALIGGAVYLVVKHWDTIVSSTTAAWDWVYDKVGAVVGAVLGFLDNLIGGAVNFVQEWGVLLLGPIGAAWKFRDEIWGVVQAVIGFFGRLVSGATEKGGELISLVAGLPGRVLGALGNLGGLLVSAGADLIWGMISGIGGMAGRLADKAISVARGAVNAVKGFLGIGSPSKVAHDLMLDVGAGMVNGLDASERMVYRAAGSLSSMVLTQPSVMDLAVRSHSAASAGLAQMATYGRDLAPAGAGPTYIIQGSMVSERDVGSLVRGAIANVGRHNNGTGLG